MKKVLFIILSLLMLSACGEPQARRPVTVKSGEFFKESVDRNRQLLAHEEQLIQSIIEKDSLQTYFSSPNGYWYYYNKKNDTVSYYPKSDDVIKLTYDIRTLDNQTIYSKEEIGEPVIKVDKEELFPGLRTALKLLNKGETMTFLFPSAMAHGYHGDDDKIGTNIPLISTVTLIDIIEISKDSISK
ncbi:gliding motility-associated peptidyl-prolyl isomerase GldI [Leptobacterium flavescens]|uniref:Peptidyl-prolyl cis-trans isomerase n=1 Tax=Leptobacterium flavescens TaxID=472055 RepID=A0A6P0UHQ4_9FLAO|nr:gliding motility-associated peptidyl-prolyl isomerase GldI [Leptobacterium flavescens]NER12152.1 gliding motility-associated peptidyl-prolyl isomerase GldI [Leptobacterium flavescens]